MWSGRQAETCYLPNLNKLRKCGSFEKVREKKFTLLLNHQTFCQLWDELSALLYIYIQHSINFFRLLSIYIKLENTYFAKIVLCVQFTNREERYVYNIHHKLLEIGFAKRGKDKYNIHEVLENPCMQMENIRWSRLQMWRLQMKVFIFKLALPHLIFVLYTTCRCKNLASPHPINMPENISDLLS